MITVHLGNKRLMISSDSSLTKLLIDAGYIEEHYAVAINRTFIPRRFHATTLLNDGDVIDIITPMQGG